MNDARSSVYLYVLLFLITSCVSHNPTSNRPVPDSDVATYLESSGYIALKSTRDSEFYVKGIIGDVKLRFTIDSGSSINVLPKKYLKKIIVDHDEKEKKPKFEESTPIIGLAGIALDIISQDNLEFEVILGGHAIPKQAFMIQHPRQMGEDLDFTGIPILGVDFLRQTSAVLCFRSQTMFMKTRENRYPVSLDSLLKSKGYHAVRLYRTHDICYAPITLNGKRARALIDTGMDQLLCSKSFVTRSIGQPKITDISLRFDAGGNPLGMQHFSTDKLKIGQYSLGKIEATMLDYEAWNNGIAYSDTSRHINEMVIGCELLIILDAYLDYENLILYIKRDHEAG